MIQSITNFNNQRYIARSKETIVKKKQLKIFFHQKIKVPLNQLVNLRQ